MDGANGSGLLNYLVPIAIAMGVILLRNSRPRRLRVETLWVFPLVYILMLASALAAAPPPLTVESLGLIVLAALIGGAIGWQRGRFTTLDLHPETHDLTARQSAIGLVFIFAIFAVRYGARGFLARNANILPIPTAAILDAFFVLAVAMLSVQRLEIWLRASKMLAEVQAAKAGTAPPTIVS